ncbi:MAG: hypothetical protein C5B47_07420 [Verrucomicrobia bacterium]|nr:MAG: hypothetical protein C5B47_07420 [Verrucomicrobiota bacterium]
MRRRIFWGLFPVFILIVGTGLYTVTLFSKLGASVGVILRENFRSIEAGQKMELAAEKMNAAFLLFLAGYQSGGQQLYDKSAILFGKNLKLAARNITLPGEADLIRKLEQADANSHWQTEFFLKADDSEIRKNTYYKEILPCLTEIKKISRELIDVNERGMAQADRNAQALSAHSVRYLIIVNVMGLVLAVFFAIRLQRAILQPIQTLRRVSRKLGEGKLDQVVPVESQDELGELAKDFNKMAAELRAYRRLTTDRIFQTQRMMETTFAAFPDPIIIFSLERCIRFTNPAANALLREVGSIEKFPGSLQDHLTRILLGKADYLPTGFDKAIILKIEDKEAYFLPRVIGIRDEEKNLFGAAVVLQDVTRGRLLDELKNNSASTVSHELKTPLNSIRMGLYLLLEEQIGTLNTQQTELLIAAREDTERLLEMINNLLDMSKFGSASFNLKTLTSEALIQRVWSECHLSLESKGSKLLTVVTEPNLPSVFVDPTRIVHVFSNLLSNALKHTKYHQPVTLSASRRLDRVRFSVKNFGEGIPSQYHSRLFDRFFRIPGTETSGVGLGLAIAKEIVTIHGGSIGVVSQEGETATEFYFDLPIGGLETATS